MDKFSGQSGTYKVNDAGERELVEGSQTRPHPEGDAPRDEHGKRTDRGADHIAAAKPQPALPEPVVPPWATPAEEESNSTKGS